MKFKRKILMEKGHLDIAPLIDVIFLLLIFFMLTSSFVLQPGIRVNLPKAVTSEVLKRDLLAIVITANGEIYIDERPTSMEEATSRIKDASNQERAVLIKADRDAELGRVINIWDLCRENGLKRINIATTQGPGQ